MKKILKKLTCFTLIACMALTFALYSADSKPTQGGEPILDWIKNGE